MTQNTNFNISPKKRTNATKQANIQFNMMYLTWGKTNLWTKSSRGKKEKDTVQAILTYGLGI